MWIFYWINAHKSPMRTQTIARVDLMKIIHFTFINYMHAALCEWTITSYRIACWLCCLNSMNKNWQIPIEKMHWSDATLNRSTSFFPFSRCKKCKCCENNGFRYVQCNQLHSGSLYVTSRQCNNYDDLPTCQSLIHYSIHLMCIFLLLIKFHWKPSIPMIKCHFYANERKKIVPQSLQTNWFVTVFAFRSKYHVIWAFASILLTFDVDTQNSLNIKHDLKFLEKYLSYFEHFVYSVNNMGCGGSKKAKPRSRHTSITRRSSSHVGSPPPPPRKLSQAKVAEPKRKSSIFKKSGTKDDDVSVRDKKEFAELVLQVITLKKGLITSSDIEKYIGLHPQKTNINAFRQKNIIRKIVADEFIKGRIAIKPIKNNCD